MADAPETPEQSLARALAAARLRRVHEAMGICRDVLAAHPEHAGAMGLLGGILGQEGQHEEAIRLLEAAIARQPAVANWHLNLCALYRNRNELDKSLRAGLESVRHAPDAANQRIELGLTHLTRGERDLASLRFREALARDPESPSAHMGLGELLLSLGEYTAGWYEYAWRNKLDQARGTLPRMVRAPWNGMHLPGGTLLLVADQGFGDMIQFARLIPEARRRVGRIVAGWGPEVTALLGRHPGIDAIVPAWREDIPHDAYCLLSTLPQLFNITLENLPNQVPYLPVDPEKRLAWQARLDAAFRQRRPRVALAWSGRPTHPNNARRTLRLEQLAPLLDVPGIDFLTVQKPFPEQDRAFLATRPALLELSAELADFADTAAVLANTDLLVSVDTAVVHLAGATARPVWAMLAEPTDWRWLLDREDSPWYPTARLFRQPRAGDWPAVLQSAAAELNAWARTKTEAA